MNFKLIKAGVAALALLAVPFAAQAADMPIKARSTRAPRSCPTTTGPASTPASTPATASAPRPGRAARDRHQAQGRAVRRHARLQLAGRLDRLRPRRRLRLVGREGQRRLRSGSAVRDQNSWLATFRGRVGYAFDRWLPYITGGGAYGNVKATAPTPHRDVWHRSKNQLGWTVGAGLEYAFLGNWTAKIEYLYVDLGSFNAGLRRRRTTSASRKTLSRRPELQVLGPIFRY